VIRTSPRVNPRSSLQSPPVFCRNVSIIYYYRRVSGKTLIVRFLVLAQSGVD
jgi:hypothetical protein